MPRLSDNEWLETLYRSIDEETVLDGTRMPGFPPDEFQIGTVGEAGRPALLEAWRFANDVTERFRASPLFASPDKRLLDFGTGWGRIARCFLRDFPPRALTGLDVSQQFIDIAAPLFPADTNFMVCAPLPPTQITAASVDFIVGYSVFSHLSERACTEWIKEFARVLRPGGMAAITTRHRAFFEHARTLPIVDDYSKFLRGMFADFDEAVARYDRGELVHAPVNEFYGETFIPAAYARRCFTDLTMTEYFEGGTVPIMFFSRGISS